jgi:hypothetical protein
MKLPLVLGILLIATPSIAEGPRRAPAKAHAAQGVKATPAPAPAKASEPESKPNKSAAPPPTARGRSKMSFGPEVVSGKQQRPSAAYVIPANVEAVRAAANGLSDDHLQSMKK